MTEDLLHDGGGLLDDGDDAHAPLAPATFEDVGREDSLDERGPLQAGVPDLPPARVVDATRKGMRSPSSGGFHAWCRYITGAVWWYSHQWDPTGDVVVIVSGEEAGEPLVLDEHTHEVV